MSVAKGYKQTEVGVIPEDWDIVLFEDIANKSKKWSITGGPFGSNLKVSDYTSDGIQIIQLQNIGDGTFHGESQVFTSSKKADEILSCNIYAGDIILSKMGDPVARACIIPTKSDRYVMASDGIRLVVDETRFSKKFIHDYINSSYFRKRAVEISTGTTRQRIGLPELKKLQVIRPPLPEQTAIANALSDMDALISQTEKLIEKKKDIKQGAMQELLKPKDGWVTKKLGEICEIIGGGTPSTANSFFWNGDINWFTPTEVGQNKYLYSSKRRITSLGLAACSARVLPAGSILLTTRAGIGDLGVLSFDAATNQGFQSLLPKAGIDNEFVYYVMHTKKSDLLQNASGSTFLEISPRRLKAIEVSLPSIERQKEIAGVLKEIDQTITLIETKLQKIKLQKQGMMQALLTGKIRLIS